MSTPDISVLQSESNYQKRLSILLNKTVISNWLPLYLFKYNKF